MPTILVKPHVIGVTKMCRWRHVACAAQAQARVIVLASKAAQVYSPELRRITLPIAALLLVTGVVGALVLF